MPKVSVLMPVYNRAKLEKWVEAAVHSVTAQRERDLEILLIDDGSTDGTLEMLHWLARTDPRIVVHSKGHSGIVGTRNYAMNRASGEFITWLDSDDLYHPDKVGREVSVLETYPDLVWVCCDYVVFESDPEEKSARVWLRSQEFLEKAAEHLTPVGEKVYLSDDDFYRFMAIHILPAWTGTIMFHGRVVETESAWFREDMQWTGEDTELWLRMAKGKRIGFIDEPLAYYRKHPGGFSAYGERYWLGTTQRHQCVWKHGEDVFTDEDILALRSKLAGFQFELGYLYFCQGRMSEARRAYLRSMKYRFRGRTFRALLKALLPKGVMNVLRRVFRRVSQ